MRQETEAAQDRSSKPNKKTRTFQVSKKRFGYPGKIASALILAGILGIGGCGGSSDVSSPRMGKIMGGAIVDKTNPEGYTLKTVPLGQDISGITYRSGKRVGVTDKDGTFYYKPGETIDFAIDRVLIGSITISTTETGYPYTKKNVKSSEEKYYIPTASTDEDRILLISMKDVAAGWEAELSEAKIYNLVGFLESLDSDKDNKNGIQIPKSTSTLVQSACDSLGISAIDFSNSSQTSAIIAKMNEMAGSGSYALSDDSEMARKCLYSAYAKYKAMPTAFFSIGDGFMAGVQSGVRNIQEATQNRGVARVLSDLLNEAADNGVWQSPLLSMDSARAVVRKSSTDENGNIVYYVPSNAGAPGAFAEDVLSKYTGSGDSIFNELMRPVTEASYLNAPATQIDTALFAASQSTAKGRLRIFSIWTGMHDVYANVIPGSSTSLDNVTAGLAEIGAVKSSISRSIDRIRSSFPDAKIFIATLPDIDTMAISFSSNDIATFVSNSWLNAIESPVIRGLEPGSRIGTMAFINKIAPKLNPGTPMETVNSAIEALSSTEILSAEELASLKVRSEALNAHIRSLADGKNVFVADLNTLYKDYKNAQFAYIDEKYLVRVPAEGFEETTSTIRYLSPIWGGGFFSSDGYYPSHTGYAIAANCFFTVMAKADLGFDPENIRKPTALKLNNDISYWYINVEAAWDIDAYRDKDLDGFPVGPGAMPPTDDPLNYIPIVSPEFASVEDCDDLTTTANKANKLPKAVTGVDCQ